MRITRISFDYAQEPSFDCAHFDTLRYSVQRSGTILRLCSGTNEFRGLAFADAFVFKSNLLQLFSIRNIPSIEYKSRL